MGSGKKKIDIKRKEKEEQRMVTFSKIRKGLFKKALELHCLTGADIAVVAFSPAGRPYVHGDPSFDATIDKYLSNGQESNNDGGGGGDWKARMMTSWLEAIQVEGYDGINEVLLVKKVVEEVREKLLFGLAQIDEDFVMSLLVQSQFCA